MDILCDFCNFPIKEAKHAYVEWSWLGGYTGHEGVNFGVVHKPHVSPLGNCYADRNGDRPEGYMSLALSTLELVDNSVYVPDFNDKLVNLHFKDTAEWREFYAKVQISQAVLGAK
tara:strand:- start:510 stop:854 length:345 start_codon:yes stop_codon:yes gene_type:complete